MNCDQHRWDAAKSVGVVSFRGMKRTKAAESPLYLRVAHQLEGQIEQGAFAIGEQIPSVRELSRRRRVSVSTVLQAYFWLEGKGKIEARPKSGFYVKAPSAHLSPAPAFRPFESKPRPVTNSEVVADLMQATHRPIKVSLGAAFTSPDVFPAHQLNSIVRRISRDAPVHIASH
jgi:DNA-binding transcriptional MocR family regulator